MRITVIGAIAIVAGVIAASLVIRHLNIKNNQGPQPNLS